MAKLRDMLLSCDVHKQRVDLTNTSKRIWEWKETPVLEIKDKDSIRCMHCHGPVEIHRQRKSNGPVDHVEHKEHRDSEHCQGGYLFKGTHLMSLNSIE